jgi:hypothetical protein
MKSERWIAAYFPTTIIIPSSEKNPVLTNLSAFYEVQAEPALTVPLLSGTFGRMG